MTNLFYTPEKIGDFIEAFAELKLIDEEARKKKCELLGVILEHEVKCCLDCNRPMLPRRLWDNLPIHERPRDCARAGDAKRCHPHLVKYRQRNGLTRGKTLSDTELQRLRKAVGLR
jgi:hypothetical protein